MLSAEDAELLQQEHDQHPSSEVLFLHPGTLRPYSPNMVRLRHEKIRTAAGIGHIRFEDLRHTFAVLALQNGMTAAEVTHLQGRCRATLTRQSYGVHRQEAATQGEDQEHEAAQVIEKLMKF